MTTTYTTTTTTAAARRAAAGADAGFGFPTVQTHSADAFREWAAAGADVTKG